MRQWRTRRADLTIGLASAGAQRPSRSPSGWTGTQWAIMTIPIRKNTSLPDRPDRGRPAHHGPAHHDDRRP
jgi:hypothetical protein